MAAREEVLFHHERGPEIGALADGFADEPRRHDANDGEIAGGGDHGPVLLEAATAPAARKLSGAQPDGLADDGRIAMETAFPSRVADDDDRVSARIGVVGRSQRVAQQRADSEHVEVIAGYESAVENVGRIVGISDGNRAQSRGTGNAVEYGIAVAAILEFGVGQHIVKNHKLPWIPDRQDAEDHAIDEREDTRVRSDAKCEGEDGDSAYARSAQHGPPAVTDVLDEGL